MTLFDSLCRRRASAWLPHARRPRPSRFVVHSSPPASPAIVAAIVAAVVAAVVVAADAATGRAGGDMDSVTRAGPARGIVCPASQFGGRDGTPLLKLRAWKTLSTARSLGLPSSALRLRSAQDRTATALTAERPDLES